KEQQKEEEEFNKTVNVIEEYVKKYGGGEDPEKPQKPEEWTSDKVIPIPDGKGGVIPLPDGYYYVGGDIDTGIVISDKPEDTMDATFPNSGNQFVWIPVRSENDFRRESFAKELSGFAGLTEEEWNQMFEAMSEPYSPGYVGEAEEYNEMRSKVLQYGGFYIGRFEAGVASNSLRTGATVAQNVVCQRGVAPYNYVSWGVNMTDTGKSGAVYLAKNKYSHPDSVVSTLCYGSQWDAMCRYIGESNRTTAQKSSPELTGSVEEDVLKNIYDLAGNCTEWTMEACYTNSRVVRAGYYGDSRPVAIRSDYDPSDDGGSNSRYSFRFTLYIA
ncbi:MAG: hypothetical protein HFJ54_06815, partial [Clostridia bacterium]|nr:hypothetical protein [Clostridia bacterium]